MKLRKVKSLFRRLRVYRVIGLLSIIIAIVFILNPSFFTNGIADGDKGLYLLADYFISMWLIVLGIGSITCG